MSSLFRVGEQIVDGRGGMLPSFQRRLVDLLAVASGSASKVINNTTVNSAIAAPATQSDSRPAILATASQATPTAIFAE